MLGLACDKCRYRRRRHGLHAAEPTDLAAQLAPLDDRKHPSRSSLDSQDARNFPSADRGLLGTTSVNLEVVELAVSPLFTDERIGKGERFHGSRGYALLGKAPV